jgi:hypothetical protein
MDGAREGPGHAPEGEHGDLWRKRPSQAGRGRDRQGSGDWSACEVARLREERDQLRMILQMVLDASVYDGAGRSVPVQDMLRGHLAARVRAAVRTRRGP